MQKIAIPLVKEKMSPHFGHCEGFKIYELNEENKIVKDDFIKSPPHEPGMFPKWLKKNEITVLIVSGIGQRAIDLLSNEKIEVVTGVSDEDPEKIINKYINDSLSKGNNLCNH